MNDQNLFTIYENAFLKLLPNLTFDCCSLHAFHVFDLEATDEVGGDIPVEMKNIFSGNLDSYRIDWIKSLSNPQLLWLHDELLKNVTVSKEIYNSMPPAMQEFKDKIAQAAIADTIFRHRERILSTTSDSAECILNILRLTAAAEIEIRIGIKTIEGGNSEWLPGNLEDYIEDILDSRGELEFLLENNN